MPNIFGFGGYGAAVMWVGPGDWRLVSLKEEFKTGSEYRFLVTYDILNSKGKIEKVEYFQEYVRLDPERKIPTVTMKSNSQLLAP